MDRFRDQSSTNSRSQQRIEEDNDSEDIYLSVNLSGIQEPWREYLAACLRLFSQDYRAQRARRARYATQNGSDKDKVLPAHDQNLDQQDYRDSFIEAVDARGKSKSRCRGRYISTDRSAAADAIATPNKLKVVLRSREENDQQGCGLQREKERLELLIKETRTAWYELDDKNAGDVAEEKYKEMMKAFDDMKACIDKLVQWNRRSMALDERVQELQAQMEGLKGADQS